MLLFWQCCFDAVLLWKTDTISPLYFQCALNMLTPPQSKCAKVCTVCPRSLGPFYIVNYYYIKRVETSWTYSTSLDPLPPPQKKNIGRLIHWSFRFSFISVFIFWPSNDNQFRTPWVTRVKLDSKFSVTYF